MLIKLFSASICLLMHSNAKAQTCFEVFPGMPGFSCTGFYILQDSANGNLSNCEKQLTVCVGVPIPPKHLYSPVDAPMQLKAGVYDNNGDYILSDVSFSFNFDYERGYIIVTPDTFPVNIQGELYPIKYELVMDCRYFDGPDGMETLPRYFLKQNSIRAFSSAKSVTDSSDISTEVVVTPPKGSYIHYLSDGIEIDAASNNSRWEFDHWSSDWPMAGLNEKEPQQVLDKECWPLTDTVEFIAWFRDLTSGIESDDPEKKLITVTRLYDFIVVSSTESDNRRWILFDMRGRIIAQTDNRESNRYLLPTGNATGPVYLIGIGVHNSYSTTIFLN